MPLNCDFYLADIVEGLPFPDGHFDFVHQRNLTLSLRSDQWSTALKELRRVCKPAGWIQLGEVGMGWVGVMMCAIVELKGKKEIAH